MDKIRITPEILEKLKEYGKKHYPEECCGLLTGNTNKIYGKTRSLPLSFHPINNVSKEKFKWDYVMDPNQYMQILRKTRLFDKKSILDLAAIFHTHPNGAPIPSQFDVTGAAWHTVYLIYGVATDKLAAWYWNGTFFKKIPINGEQISPDTIYSDGEERIWKSWRDVGSLS